MEKWQVEHITKNLTELINLTTFNCIVESRLVENCILNHVTDVSWLNAQKCKDGISAACSLYYQKLTGRARAYKVLYNALVETNQSGAARILVRVPPELFSKPLTYLGIITEVTSFKDANIEVNGKVVKLTEFFSNVDFKSLQKIFHETVSELEIYDTFITKERTFALSKNTIPLKPPYYISRFLSNRIKIDKSIFKSDCLDVFVFKNSTARYQLTQIAKPHFTSDSTSQLAKITSRFIHLDEDEDWVELKKLAKVPIHLINYEAKGKFFLFEDTSAAPLILEKVGSRKERIYMSEEEFVQQQLVADCASSSVCICDTPGMGKTFLLANIARLMTENCAGRIIVFIQLTTFTNEIFLASLKGSPEPDASLMHVLGYISLHHQNSELLLQLVKAKLLQLEIFFDGYDELSEDNVTWTKQLFRSITTNFSTVRIYITSRSHMRQELEQSLGVVAYDILPFNQQNQVNFLVQFWQNTELNSFQSSLKKYAIACLKTAKESLSTSDREITGIPLLCQLIAEVNADKKAFRSIKRRKLSDVPFKISGMYQKFIEKKFELVTIDKQDFGNIKLVHIWHALKLLFPTDDFHKDHQFDNIENLLTSPKILKIGILQKHSNEALEFIHRTFAEYLIAQYCFTEIQMQKKEMSTREEMSILRLILKLQTGNQEFVHPVIVSFFDSAIGEVKISEHLSIRATTFVSSILQTEFIKILCACCQHDFFNIFYFLREVLTKCDKSSVLECFTHENCHELLKVCIENSNNRMFHSCIQLLTEILQLDIAQINTFNREFTLFRRAIRYAHYEAVEYFVDRISLHNQSLLKWAVHFRDTVDKRENILNLLHNKDPTLIQEIPNILLTYGIDVRFFKILVKFGATLTAVDEDNGNCVKFSAYHMSRDGFEELVHFLLTDCKAEYLFLENEKWKDPLPYIIRYATLSPKTLELLLNIPGIDINMKSERGEHLLFSAVKGSKLNNLQQLVEFGLNYNARGKDNRSLLHVAAWWGDLEILNYLLSLKLDPNSRDKMEWTPLHHAADGLNATLSIFKVLVENGTNLHAKNNIGQTALHLVATTKNYPSIEIINYLIKKGAGVNDQDNDGNTPLHLCQERIYIELLIEIGADIQAKNIKGETAAQMNPELWKSAN